MLDAVIKPLYNIGKVICEKKVTKNYTQDTLRGIRILEIKNHLMDVGIRAAIKNFNFLAEGAAIALAELGRQNEMIKLTEEELNNLISTAFWKD